MTEEPEEPFVFIPPTENTRGNELTPMLDLTFVKNTFIAIDVENPETTPEDIRRFVGTVVGFDEKDPLICSVLHLQDPDDETHIASFVINDIVRAYWAPMGYRP